MRVEGIQFVACLGRFDEPYFWQEPMNCGSDFAGNNGTDGKDIGQLRSLQEPMIF